MEEEEEEEERLQEEEEEFFHGEGHGTSGQPQPRSFYPLCSAPTFTQITRPPPLRP
jgi:hypothetical protein